MVESIKWLVNNLNDWHIPYELTDDVMGNKDNQLWYPNRENPICDVICHSYSYGGKEGLLEIMGLNENEDGVEGYLLPGEVFNRIFWHYCRNN